MIYKHICEWCGKEFRAKSAKRKYCCKGCAKDALDARKNKEDQLCWICKKACGDCPWSDRFEEVEGWVATKTIVKDSAVEDFISYKVEACPLFERG